MMGDTGNDYIYPDPEAPKNFTFSEQSIRRGFIRKVYMILMVKKYFINRYFWFW